MSLATPELTAQLAPTPIVVPSEQSSFNPMGSVTYNAAVYNLPGTNVQGADLMTHLQFNIRAGVNLEWCAKTILQFSNSPNASYLVKTPWVLDYLLNDLYENFDKTSALSIRNLAQESDFIQMLALHPRTKRVLYEVLSHFEEDEDEHIEELPLSSSVVQDIKLQNLDNELLIYTIDIVESVSSYFAPAPKDDDLFLALTKIFVNTNDRSLLISIMRSFARFLVRSELSVEDSSSNFTPQIFDKIVSFLLTDDYDLVLTSLDFLYQYSLPGNIRISNLLKSTTRQDILRTRLPQLLTFQQIIKNNPNDFANLQPLRLNKRTKPPIPASAPKLSPEHYKEVSVMNEPLRATSWMRCCYRAVEDGEVTQISLWKAYEQQFEKDISKKKLLPAVDFIKNVSQAFNKSNAMVLNLANGQRKFIIKGIEPRFQSVDVKTGESEAFQQVKVPDYASMVSERAQQEPIEPYTPPAVMNDVNTSTVMFLTSLTNHPQGRELFRPLEEDLLRAIETFPALYDELADALKYIQSDKPV